MARYELIMEKLSVTMEKGTVVQWLKNPGDSVAVGDPILEVTTDKASVIMESSYSGILEKSLVRVGDTVPVKTVVAYIEGEEGQIDLQAMLKNNAEPTAPSTRTTPPSVEVAKAATPTRVVASPAAKRLAKEKGIDLALICGSGPDGRIQLEDIENYEKNKPRLTSVAANVARSSGVDTSLLPTGQKLYKKDVMALASEAPPTDESVPLTNIQETMAKRMSESWHNAPHVTYCRAFELTAINGLRSALADTGIKASVTDVIVKAVAVALDSFPLLNSSFGGDAIVYHSQKNIGIATDTPNGLLVPVVVDCLNKSLSQIAVDSKRVIKNAREGKSTLNEITGGTFTISNLGMMGIDYFTPIINPPESAILGVCAKADKQVIENGNIAIKPFVNLCLSCDHRHIDGATAARFLDKLVWILEHPYFLN